MMSETKAAGAIASHRGRAERRNNLPYVKNINIPCLIIAGEKDYFFKATAIENMAKDIPNSQFEVIPKSGHLPNMEQPETFNKLIRAFLKA
jgi:pimeloyl-ACP methyl ester carboxylesterase